MTKPTSMVLEPGATLAQGDLQGADCAVKKGWGVNFSAKITPMFGQFNL